MVNGCLQHLLREDADRGRHRGAEEEGLALGGKVTQHLLDVGEEAHVEHPVGFVEHEVLEAGQLGVRLAEVIEQATRCGNDHVHAAPERVLLRTHADATEHGGAGDRCVDGEVLQVLVDLRREFARRREHERPGDAARTVDELVHDREDEGCRLAAAGHRAGEDVATFEGRRDGCFLDRGGAGETEFLHPLEEAGVKLEATERHDESLFGENGPAIGQSGAAASGVKSLVRAPLARGERLSGCFAGQGIGEAPGSSIAGPEEQVGLDQLELHQHRPAAGVHHVHACVGPGHGIASSTRDPNSRSASVVAAGTARCRRTRAAPGSHRPMDACSLRD